MQYQQFKKSGPLAALITAVSLMAGSAQATDYNDAFWANPNANTDFIDQFATPSLNRSKWLVEQNIYVNGEDQDYQDVEYPAADWTVRSANPDAGAMDGNALNLKARYMDGAVQDYYGGVANQGKPLFIRSGRLESLIADSSTFTYGKFEARIKMPPARNAEFPAWWLLGNFPDVGWTACQELDIIEFTGANATNAPQTHWSAPYAIYGGNPVTTSYASLGVAPSAQYVTYGVIKTPDSIEFYINGTKTYSWSRTTMGEQQPWPYVTPMRMILNHAITHVEWPDVGNYNKFTTDANIANKTGYSRVTNGVTEYEYLDTAGMNANIGRAGTDFLVDYVAHWPLPSTDPLQKYVDESKYSFFRPTGNTKGFYSLKGWLAPVAVTGDAYLNEGNPTDLRDNGADNAADGYTGSKWATPKDDNLHSIDIDYGTDKPIKYVWLEWGWNLPKSYDIYGKTASGAWEFVLSSDQEATGWTKHVFDINKTYRYIKLVTKGRIDKSDSIWLQEFMAFEDVANVYPKPAGTPKVDRAINMIGNGTFTSDLTGWNTEKYDGATPVFAAVGGQAKITTTNQGAGSGSIQLHTEGFGLKRNYRYQVSFKAKADTARNIQIRLSEDNLNPSAGGTYLLQTIPLTTTLATQTFTVDFTAADNAGRLAFLLGNMGTATVYIDDVVIKEIAYIGSGDPLVKAIDATNFVSASSGWETEWWGIAQRAIDGATGNKASGNDGQSEGMDLWVSVKIDPEYEVKEVLVAGDKSAPRSLAQFKVEYGANTMINWTNSNGDGVYETFNTFNSAPPVSTRDFKISFRPPAGQLVEVSEVQFMAVDYKPYRIYTMGLDMGGTISPSGTLRFSKNNTDSQNYTFTPPVGRTVANVIVDGVSLGALTNYTFTNINKSHTLAVAYTSSGAIASSSSSSSVASSAPNTGSSSSATVTGVLVSQGRIATTNSQFQPAANAVDGNMGTRWETAAGVSPSWLMVDLGTAQTLTSVVIDWEAANAGSYQIQGTNNGTTWTTLKTVTAGTFGNRTDTHNVSGSYRYVRVYATERSVGNQWGYSIYELKVYAQAAASSSSSVSSASSTSSSSTGTAGQLNIVTATASTAQSPAINASDKNSGTRWESTHGVDPSWISFDLGAAKNLSSIAIDWEAANAADYLVQGSNDNANWSNIANKTGGAFGTRTDTLALSGNYRYVRIYGTARSAGNQWGYSIWEVRVSGN